MKPVRNSFTSRAALLALLLLCAAGVLVLPAGLQATTARGPASREPHPVADHWPPFQMTYQLTEFDPRTQAVKYTAPYFVEWTDRRHWRKTLLDPSGDLAIGGVEWEQNGDQHWFTARPGAPRWSMDRLCPVCDILPTPAEFLIPEFFVPEKLRLMKNLPEHPVWSDGDGHTSFRYTPRPGGSEQYQATYRDSDGMPLQWVVYDDGILRRIYDVLELHLLNVAADAGDEAALPLPWPAAHLKKP
jgi:hypothetical protein